MTETQELEAAIVALQAQRSSLGDDVVDAALGPLRDRIAFLNDNDVQEKPAAPAPAAMQRRQITVLFADIVGSTSLGEKLDAEDMVHLMSRALERFVGTEHRFQSVAGVAQHAPVVGGDRGGETL